ncbi:hypothetical protein BX600DRAFT_550647 [Xylariales sp. PMI_506]|nr:hypothetical protein BX600DRAFT_550647 [Xylariales sp. PMI_506]
MPRRSRGCLRCRKRRRKCDGALPSCGQCVLANQPCSGPLQGSIFIDQTAHVTSTQRKKRLESESYTTLSKAPSHRAIFSAAFMSEFLSYITSITESTIRPAWLVQLQDIPEQEKGPVLDLSLQAAATAYCGVEAKNPTVLWEGCRMYGEALMRQSKIVSQHKGEHSMALILTSVVLSLFEAIWSTNATAYSLHLSAALAMSASAGEYVLENELLMKVAMHIQYQKLYVAMVSPNANCIDESEKTLRAVTLRSQTLYATPVVDRLMTQLFALRELISVGRYGYVDKTLYCDISSNTDRLWGEYKEEATSRGEPLQKYGSKGEIVYRDGATALTLAFFATARILLSLVKLQGSDEPSRPIEDQCQTIIDCGIYLIQAKGIIGCAGLPMFLPVTLVARYSTSLKQRKVAYMFLAEGIDGIAFNGMRSMAIDYINSTSSENLPFVGA